MPDGSLNLPRGTSIAISRCVCLFLCVYGNKMSLNVFNQSAFFSATAFYLTQGIWDYIFRKIARDKGVCVCRPNVLPKNNRQGIIFITGKRLQIDMGLLLDTNIKLYMGESSSTNIFEIE